MNEEGVFMAKRRKKKTENSLKNTVIRAFIGAAAGTVIFFAFTFLLSFFCLKRDTDPTNFGFIELAVGAIAGFFCGYIAVKPIGKNGLVTGALSSLPMYLTVIAVSVLLSHTGVGIFGWILAAVMIIASAVGGFVSI